MKSYFLTLLFFLVLSVSYGQYPDALFEATKGRWILPISHIVSVDTMQRDCYGWPTRSSSIILRTQTPEKVTAIQNGLVQNVIKIDSLNVVAVKTGHFFLFYFGLSNVNVKRGGTIYKGNTIGNCGKENNESNYHVLLTLTNENAETIDLIPWFDWTTAHNNCLPQ